MSSNRLLLLKGDDVISLLQNREQEVLTAVGRAYQVHARGHTTLPHSSFIRFPGMEKERIIALPAYLGEDFNTAGIKWIASFPQNVTRGMERASAVLILNSMATGQPLAIMESSTISAKRTAASAALAARYLWSQDELHDVSLVGCGLINFETLRFLLSVYPMISSVHLCDLSADNALQFKDKCLQLNRKLQVDITDDFAQVAGRSPVISLATTAVTPHISDLSCCLPNSVILHISLRDLSPDIILQADNIVDDVDHVSRAQTSIHLTEQQVGHRDFVRGTLGDILNGTIPSSVSDKNLTIFSPFGLGVLDLAVAQLTVDLAAEQGLGIAVDSFLPKTWLERSP